MLQNRDDAASPLGSKRYGRATCTRIGREGWVLGWVAGSTLFVAFGRTGGELLVGCGVRWGEGGGDEGLAFGMEVLH